MIDCYIVDDEPLARRALKSLLGRIPDCRVVGEAAGGAAAMQEVRSLDVDLLFLDIRMPEVTGLELARALKDPPAIVFTTAHREHAVEGFEVDALDYLVKPIGMSRLLRAVDRYRSAAASKAAVDAHWTVRADRKTVRVRIREIRYIESIRDYVKIVLPGDSILTKKSLTDAVDELEPHGFIRIHRSFAVNKAHVSSFSSEEVVVDGTTLPVGRAFRQDALELLEGC